MSTTVSLPYQLDRVVTIDAPPDTVFSFFTDSQRWAQWWGAGSTIDARPGGRMLIHHANGVEVTGEVVSVEPPRRIAFTYGYASGKPIPPGGSRVTIELQPSGTGTRLHLIHDFLEQAPRDHHVQGWRYQLALFANVVTDLLHAGAPSLVDRWFEAWNDLDPVRRRESVESIVSPDVQFKDRFGLTGGIEELLGHIAAVHQFMPGLRLERSGEIKHCQGLVLADWTAVGKDGQTKAKGTNAYLLSAEGRIAAVTGFWSNHPSS
jgi:uncharacterized protein YndB with AHSA1/START domain